MRLRRISIIVPMLGLAGAVVFASRGSESVPRPAAPASQRSHAQPGASSATDRTASGRASAAAAQGTASPVRATLMPSRPRAAGAAAPGRDFETTVKPFVEAHCLDCHSTKKRKGGLDLEQYQTRAAMLDDPAQWEEVVRKLSAREMPPEDEPPPDPAAVKAVTSYVSREIERTETLAARDPGRVTTRRLNRTEYNNTIRDLLAVDLRPADDFPLDDSGYGFDNIGDVLSLSPVLMERYLTAAERIVRTALHGAPPMTPTLLARLVPGPRTIPEIKTPPATYDRTGLSLPNALHAAYQFPADAEYVFQIALGGLRPAGSEPLPITLWIDGQEVQSTTLDASSGASFYSDRQDFSGKTVEMRLRVSAGPHIIAAAVPRLYEGLPARYDGPRPSTLPPPPPEEFKPPADAPPDRIARMRAAFDKRQKEIVPIGEPRISIIDVLGPYGQAAGPSDESLARIFVCGHRPGSAHGTEHHPLCARTIVSSFAARAFRRPVTPADVDRYLRLVDVARTQGDSFDDGIGVALQAILVSPDFLFRLERTRVAPAAATSTATSTAAAPRTASAGARAGAAPGAASPIVAYPITQHELASRLSYFLWASLPDAELRRHADRGTLRTPAVLRAQVTRMLRDPRARTLAQEFGGQWLQFRALESLTRDKDRFPDFEDYLRTSMRRETELFFEHIVRDDRPITDFLDAPYTFVNERLARHYGLRGVTGPEFRRVNLADPAISDSPTRRGGVLTHASVLTVSSYATRTSPVIRGKWILENILGTPPKDPPPDVPNLDEAKVGTTASLREQLEAHRKNAVCASCHKRMDPLGFGLENFDAIGAWRTADGNFPIDATGTLPDGREFNGPEELRAILTGDREAFTRCLTEKLLIYALGRGLEKSDRHTVKTIGRRVAAQQYRFSSLVLEIVTSRPFQMRRAVPAGVPSGVGTP